MVKLLTAQEIILKLKSKHLLCVVLLSLMSNHCGWHAIIELNRFL